MRLDKRHSIEEHNRYGERNDTELTGLANMKPKDARDYIKTLTTKQALGVLAFAVCKLLRKD